MPAGDRGEGHIQSVDADQNVRIAAVTERQRLYVNIANVGAEVQSQRFVHIEGESLRQSYRRRRIHEVHCDRDRVVSVGVAVKNGEADVLAAMPAGDRGEGHVKSVDADQNVRIAAVTQSQSLSVVIVHIGIEVDGQVTVHVEREGGRKFYRGQGVIDR